MKKIYEAPTMVEVKVDLQNHLMEGSPLGRSESAATVSGGEYQNSLSRGGSDWDDDDY